jgi:hypothetical protein
LSAGGWVKETAQPGLYAESAGVISSLARSLLVSMLGCFVEMAALQARSADT